MQSKSAIIAMSGGVDSSVAALLVKSSGMNCIGCTMKLYAGEITENSCKTCCSLNDVEDARSVAMKLGMPYYVFNFTDDFDKKVISRFIHSYLNGETPNPCIDCNKYMKFDNLILRAKTLGYDYVVTGHYARIEFDGEKYKLKKAIDETKDQSYVLYNLSQEQLKHILFPLGNLTKKQVREIAQKNGFRNSNKPDSQDICFIPDGNYTKFICERMVNSRSEGNFVDTKGNVIGKHKGIFCYTIGQRKGLGISASKPLYVVSINTDTNNVVLGEERELYSKTIYVKDFNWISGKVPTLPLKCKVKIRYRQKEQDAIILSQDNNVVQIEFKEPQRAVTPGQSAVAYVGDEVIGGGIIVKKEN